MTTNVLLPQLAGAVTPAGFYGIDKNKQVTDIGSAMAIASAGQFGRQDVTANGDVSAYTNSHALAIASAMQKARSQNLIGRIEYDKQRMQQLATAALQDPQAWGGVVATAAQTVREVGARDGWLRNALMFNEVGQGEEPKINMPKHSVVATMSMGQSEVGYQEVNDRFFYAPEHPLVIRVQASEFDIVRSPGDKLQELFDQATQAGIVIEDRLMFKALRAMANVGDNEETVVTGELTPKLLASLCNATRKNALPANTLYMSANLWDYLLGNSSFHSMFDPVTRHELIMTGRIATIMGHTIATDGFRQDTLRVMQDGEMIAVTDKEFLGAYSDRGGWRTTNVDLNSIGIQARGFVLTEYFSLAVTNSSGVKRMQVL